MTSNGAEVSDDDKLHFVTSIADCISRDEAVMAQVNNHTPEQVMHGLLPARVQEAVMDAMNDQETLTMPVLENEETGRQFAMLVLKMLLGSAERELVAGKRFLWGGFE